MNHHLQQLLESIQQSEHLSGDEKASLSKAIKEADKEMEITAFKLDRTEQVKKTTAILLEETIAELEQKRKAVEEQNRDLEIEASLERVRTVAMAMRKPDDMLDVCRMISDQLQLLGFKEIRNVQTVIIYEQKHEYLNYQYFAPYDKDSIEVIDYRLHPDVLEFTEKMLQSADAYYTKTFEGEALQRWRDYRKQTGQLSDPKLDEATSSHYYFYSIGAGALGVTTYAPLSEEQIDLFKRFRNVFELAYRRFIDIQRAEAQAREAQIEVSLERVRSRAMAMHKTDELLDAAELIYKELSTLGISSMNVSYAFVDEQEKTGSYYSVNPVDGKTLPFPFVFPHTETKVMRSLLSSWKKQEPFKVIELDEEETLTHQTYIGEHIQLVIKKNNQAIPFSVDAFLAVSPKKAVIYNFNFPQGYIFIIGSTRLTTDQEQIVLRFTKVFELTYRRFLDLKKAETQARESQIELALERVRARTMAMQRSDELSDAASMLFKQVSDFGIKVWSSAFQIWNADDISTTAWASAPDGSLQAPFRLPYDEDIFFKQIYQARQRGEDFFVMESSGKELEVTYHYMFNLPGVKKYFDDAQDLGFSIPKYQITHCAFFSTGYLMFITYEPCEEMWDIFKRFARVFEQTYTRFLDLQKAEAQAREAQIEVSLERVRSRAMAMHKSEELQEVANTLFEKLTELNIKMDSANIAIFKEGTRDFEYWVASPYQKLVQSFRIPYSDLLLTKDMVAARESGTEFHTKTYSFVEKNEWFNYAFENTDFKFLSEERKQMILDTKAVTISIAFSKNTGIQITSYSEELLSQEKIEILKRFAKVFEQAYIRFLDLQKAEAQAREAQIEVALERVRARVMAMQNSDELKELIGTVFIELTKLDLILTRCLIMIFDPETSGSTWWMANSEAPTDPISLYIKYHEYPPYLAYVKSWKEQANKWQYILEGEDKKNWDDFIFVETELAQLPDFVIAGMKAPERVYLSSSFNNFGCLNLASLEPLSDEHFDILLRFARVFDLTYTRFNDLKQAEAQAREAQIELALERVRARTMAMQKSDELAEAASLLFHQVKALGVDTYSSGFIIWDKENQHLISWMCNADGSMNPPFVMPLAENDWHVQQYESWKRGEDFVVKDMTGEVLQSYFQYLRSFPLLDKAFKISIAAGHPMPERQVHNVANFSHGSLLIITYEPLTEAHGIFKRFAKVFDQTYTRFLDLQKAEAQSREAQIEAALERVRAKVMAMNSSKDLNETSFVFGEQLRKLGIDWQFSYFWLIEEDKDENTFWITWPDNKTSTTTYSLAEADESFRECIIAWKEKVKIHTSHVPVQDVQAWLDTFERITNDAGGVAVEIMKNDNFPEGVYYYDAMIRFGSFGILMNREINDEEKNIQVRFATEFERAYRRFLDLQQAEAQTREAQIELALERVRARTMAMQKSDELREAVLVIYEQLQHLGFGSNACNIIIVDEKSGAMHYWVSGFTQEVFPEGYHVPYLNHPYHNALLEASRQKKKYAVMEYSGEMKKSFDEIFFTQTDFRNIPEDAKEFMKGLETVKLSTAFFNVGALQIIGGVEVNGEKAIILQRFAKVFEQTYTRFLDLQKAEAQAREARIEAALEKIRSRTMAMQKGDELKEVVVLLYKELIALGVTNFVTCGYVEINEKINRQFTWVTSPGGDSLGLFYLPLTGDATFNERFAAWKQQEIIFHQEVSGEVRTKHLEYAITTFNSKDAEEMVLSQFPDPTVFYCFNFSHGYLHLVTGSKLKNEEEILLARFTRVFEQTYARFLDLQKAEAQAREAEIQLALERVRARTMAMQKSEELKDVANEMRNQIGLLGQKELETCAIHLYDVSPDYFESWAALRSPNNEGEIVHIQAQFPKKGVKIIEEAVRCYESGKKNYVLLNDAPKAIEFFEMIKQYAPEAYTVVSESVKGKNVDEVFAYWSVSDFSGGSLIVTSMVVPDENSCMLLQKFANVFGLAYRRFADLKNAEAQAREANIEAALEKVRSRTMAMQRSEELSNVATVLFQQVKSLGVPQWTCGFCIWDIGDTECMWYPGSPDGEILAPARFPLTEHPVFRIMDESRKRGDELYIYEKEGEVQADHYRYMMTLPGVRELLQGILDVGLTFPTFQVDHYANFAYGNLIFITYEHFPEMHDIFKRFAKVFEQTYTRFLDLQKAEAQTREAQIEAVLERVRSRTMAMQKSDELTDVAALLFEQVSALGIKTWTAGFNVWSDDNNSYVDYITSPNGGFIEPYTVHTERAEALRDISNARKSGVEFDVQFVEGEKIKQLYLALTRLDEKQYEIMLQDGIQFPSHQYEHFVFGSKVSLMFITYEPVPEAHDIFKRLGKVFEQTYTRFLDLQKAEAQAREAQIQLSLERVRARAMAMYHSEELGEVLSLLFDQFDILGIHPVNTSLALIDTDKNSVTLRMTGKEGKRVIGKHEFEMDSVDLWKETGERWKTSEPDAINCFHYPKETLPEMWELFSDVVASIPEDARPDLEDYPDGIYVTEGYCKFGYLGFSHSRPATEEEKAIVLKFATEFGIVHQRFLDLQKAEAQAREAQIQLALERVRARTMAMQHSDELGEAASLLFKQVTDLGIQTWTSGFNIWQEKDTSFFGYNPTPSGGITPPYRIPSNEDLFFLNILQAKERGEEFIVFEWQDESLAETYRYMKTLPVVKEVLTGIEDSGFPLPTFQINHCVFFAQGFLLFITLQPYPQAHDIFQRFGKVFEQTYTRFLDLQKAEAQARQAKIEAAMEKVRSRAMAMQKPDELVEVAELLRHEMGLLGVEELETSSIYIHHNDTGKTECWYAIKDVHHPEKSVVSDHMIINLAETAVGREMLQFYQSKEKQLSIRMQGQARKEWINYCAEHSKVLEGFYGDVIPDRSYHLYKFSHGYMGAASAGDISAESWDLLQRATSVFALAYTRFSDLQQAAEQAREAQIEAALERVRSRSMGMQRSEELKEVIQVVYDQFIHLNVHVEHTGFLMDYKERDDMLIWLADKNAVLFQVTLPYFECAHWNSFIEAKEKGKDFFSNYLSFEEKNKFYHDLFKLVPGVREETLEYYFSCPGLAISTVLLENVGLYIENFSGTPYSNEENKILMRFGKVFQQTYTRFLDLQKAEAQSREATIEAALERVRGKALAMQNSNDLSSTASMVFTELRKLGINPIRCGVGLLNKDSRRGQLYSATSSADGDSLGLVGWVELSGHPVLQNIYDTWLKGEEYYPQLSGEQLKSYYELLLAGLSVSVPDWQSGEKQYGSFLPFSVGCLYAWSANPYDDAEIKILKRFATIIDLTFRRYIELQKIRGQCQGGSKTGFA